MLLGMDRGINWFDIKSQTERFGIRAKPLFEGIFNNLTEYFHPDSKDNAELIDEFLKDFEKENTRKVVNK